MLNNRFLCRYNPRSPWGVGLYFGPGYIELDFFVLYVLVSFKKDVY